MSDFIKDSLAEHGLAAPEPKEAKSPSDKKLKIADWQFAFELQDGRRFAGCTDSKLFAGRRLTREGDHEDWHVWHATAMHANPNGNSPFDRISWQADMQPLEIVLLEDRYPALVPDSGSPSNAAKAEIAAHKSTEPASLSRQTEPLPQTEQVAAHKSNPDLPAQTKPAVLPVQPEPATRNPQVEENDRQTVAIRSKCPPMGCVRPTWPKVERIVSPEAEEAIGRLAEAEYQRTLQQQRPAEPRDRWK